MPPSRGARATPVSDPTPLSDEWFSSLWRGMPPNADPELCAALDTFARTVAATALRWAAHEAGVTIHHPDGTITSSRERIRAEADRVEGSK